MFFSSSKGRVPCLLNRIEFYYRSYYTKVNNCYRYVCYQKSQKFISENFLKLKILFRLCVRRLIETTILTLIQISCYHRPMRNCFCFVFNLNNLHYIFLPNLNSKGILRLSSSYCIKGHLLVFLYSLYYHTHLTFEVSQV